MKKKKALPDSKNGGITFKLKGFNIRRFELIEPGTDLTTNFDINKLKFGFDIDFIPIMEKDLFQIIFTVVYKYELDGSDVQLCSLILLANFEIKNISSIIEINDEEFKAREDVLNTFVSLIYSTARGIIFTKTQGSYLNQFILPVIDPKIIINNKLQTFIKKENSK